MVVVAIDTSITTDYASLFVEDEYFSRIKMHVDLVRALIDKRKQIVATTSEESFEGVGKRVRKIGDDVIVCYGDGTGVPLSSEDSLYSVDLSDVVFSL